MKKTKPEFYTTPQQSLMPMELIWASTAKTHHMNVDYSGYEGWEVKGKVKTVLLRGKVVIDNNECKVQKGYGQFVKRNKVAGKI